MACSRGKANPSQNTRLRLFADSGGYCQNPGCNIPLFAPDSEKDSHLAEMAHIFAANDTGPRANVAFSEEERGRYENIILLCANCHTLIDKEPEVYKDAVVTGWKQGHVQKLQETFGIRLFKSREELKSELAPLFLANKAVHVGVGPDNEYKYNAEAAEARAWKTHVKSTIIPNSLKILMCLDKNAALLSAEEWGVVEKFRFHVKGLIARHVEDEAFATSRFPVEITRILEN